METAASVSSAGASLDSFKLVAPRKTDVWTKRLAAFRGNPYRDALDAAVGFLAKRKNRAVLTLSRKNHFADLFPCHIKDVLDLQYLLVIKARVVGKDRAGNFPDAPTDPGK